jgi:hypothetical protein
MIPGMTAAGRATCRAIVGCMLLLGCLVSAGWQSAHGAAGAAMDPMSGAMVHQVQTVEVDTTGERPSEDPSQHCEDSGQQCQPATVDNSSSPVPSGHSSGVVASTSTLLEPATLCRDERPPRPPDLHALCVNRI